MATVFYILCYFDLLTNNRQHIREHEEKTFDMLSKLWLLRGWGRGLSESVEKEIFVTKIFFFSDNVE